MRFLILAVMFFTLSDVFAENRINTDAKLVKSITDTKLAKLIEENKQTELRNYLKKKIPTDAKNAALQLAVEKNRVKIARALIDSGANINVQDENGITPLMAATLLNYPKMVEMLLISNANNRIEDNNGDTALIHSIRVNNMECFNILSGTYPEIDERKARGKALFIAMKLGRIEMAKILVNDQLNPKGDIAKALILAARKEYIDVIKLLTEKGADVNATNSCGYTALMEACNCGRTDIVKFLIGEGANVNAYQECGNTALMFVIDNKNLGEEDCMNLVKLLIEYGANVNVRNKIGETALIQALKKRRFATAKLLLNNGADIWVKDRQGDYALLLWIKNAFTIMRMKTPIIQKH